MFYSLNMSTSVFFQSIMKLFNTFLFQQSRGNKFYNRMLLKYFHSQIRTALTINGKKLMFPDKEKSKWRVTLALCEAYNNTFIMFDINPFSPAFQCFLTCFIADKYELTSYSWSDFITFPPILKIIILTSS